jgi:hypothetical protein
MQTHLERAAAAAGACAARKDADDTRRKGAESHYAQHAIPPPSRTLLTVQQLADQQPGLTVGGIRWDLFNRKSNSLEESGAIVYRGRKILIDPERYLQWLANGQRAA